MDQAGRKVEVWIPSGSDWALADQKMPRYRESLILPVGVFQQINDDAIKFQKSKAWYDRMGIPWRRGYVLHGPPGNGKSSLAHVLASELGTNVNVANLTIFYDDTQLTSCLSRVPKGHVLLLEDVDAAFNGREAKNGVKVSFAALLNALDGMVAQEGRILILTTNHIDKIDPALIRPGRADVSVLFDNASTEQAVDIFERFFPDAPMDLKQKFGMKAAGLSMATIQEHLMRHRDSASEAVADVIGESGLAVDDVITEAA